MRKPTRRGLLAGTAAALGTKAAPPKAHSAELAVSPDHPDAELIRACAEHAVNIQAVNAGTSDDNLVIDDDPFWLAYQQTRNFISAAKPKALAGMLAKARAAKAEALCPDGSEKPENTPGQRWAWDLVGDLLAGKAGDG